MPTPPSSPHITSTPDIQAYEMKNTSSSTANVKRGQPVKAQGNVGKKDLPIREEHTPISTENAPHRVGGEYAIGESTAPEELDPQVQRALESHRNKGSTKLSKDEVKTRRDEARQSARALAAKQNRQFDPALMARFRAIKEEILRTGNTSRAAELVDILLQMHGKTREQINKGFKQGGATYSYRNMIGNLITMAGLAFIFVAAENRGNPEKQSDLFTAYFFVNILAAYLGSQTTALSLPGIVTPLQDSEFAGSATIHKDIKEIPPYDKIIENLQAIDGRVAADPELQAAVTAFQANPDDPALQAALEEKLNQADGAAQPKGLKQSNLAIWLNRAYIEGLRLVTLFNTGKALAATIGGLVGGFMGDVRIAAITLIVAQTIQMIGQRFVSPHDMVTLQTNFLKMVVLSRELTGDDEKDRVILNEMFQEPEDVRRTQLENILTAEVETAQQEMSDILKKAEPGINTNNFRDFSALEHRVENAERFEYLRTQVEPAKLRAADPDEGEHAGLAGQLGHAFQSGDTVKKERLIGNIAEQLGVDRDGYGRRIELEMVLRGGERELTPEESVEFATLTEEHTNALQALPNDEQFQIIGLGGLEMMLFEATRTKDFDEEDRLIGEMAEKLNVSPEIYREYYMLSIDPARSEPLSEEEAATHQELKALVTNARDNLNAKQADKFVLAEDKYKEIRNDPLAAKSMRLDVSEHHLKLVSDGMKVESHKWLPKRTELGMIAKEGRRRLGNAPELLSTSASMVGRGFQSLLGGPLGSTITTGLVGMVTAQYRENHTDNPLEWTAPVWAKAVAVAPIAGLWGMHSYYAWQSSKAKTEPMGVMDGVSVGQGSTGSYFETSVQNWKLVERDVMRANPRYGERGFWRVMKHYSGDMLKLGGKAMFVMVNQSRKTKDMEDARQRALTSLAAGRAERDRLRGEIAAHRPAEETGERSSAAE